MLPTEGQLGKFSVWCHMYMNMMDRLNCGGRTFGHVTATVNTRLVHFSTTSTLSQFPVSHKVCTCELIRNLLWFFPLTDSIMDPITIVGFVAAVVQLIGVISKVVDSFNDMKDAPKNRAKLVREATGLLALFADLRYRVEETASTDPWFTGLRSLGAEGGPLMEFKSAMEDITDKLVPVRGGVKFGRVLRRTFDMKEIEAILSKIERVKSLVGLALQNDQL